MLENVEKRQVIRKEGVERKSRAIEVLEYYDITLKKVRMPNGEIVNIATGEKGTFVVKGDERTAIWLAKKFGETHPAPIQVVLSAVGKTAVGRLNTGEKVQIDFKDYAVVSFTPLGFQTYWAIPYVKNGEKDYWLVQIPNGLISVEDTVTMKYPARDFKLIGSIIPEAVRRQILDGNLQVVYARTGRTPIVKISDNEVQLAMKIQQGSLVKVKLNDTVKKGIVIANTKDRFAVALLPEAGEKFSKIVVFTK